MTGREADVTALAWLAGAFALGGVVGAAYFAGLWATVRALPAARRPVLLVFASFTVRFGSAATTFVLLARTGGWPWIAAAFAGFVLARAVIIRRLLPPGTMPAEDAIWRSAPTASSSGNGGPSASTPRWSSPGP